MATPIEKIYNTFHTQFVSKYAIAPELERAYLENSIADFESELYSLTIDDINSVIEEDLNRTEVLLLGKLMYKYYLHQERQGINLKLSIYGRDIKQTGLDVTKRMLENSYSVICSEIDTLYHKLKQNTLLD
jgi:hypothetical protein